MKRRDFLKFIGGCVASPSLLGLIPKKREEVLEIPFTTPSSASTTTSSDNRVYIWESDGFSGQFFTIDMESNYD